MRNDIIKTTCTVTPRFTKAEPGPHDVTLRGVNTHRLVNGRYFSQYMQRTTLPNATEQEAQDAAKVMLELYLMSRQSLTDK